MSRQANGDYRRVKFSLLKQDIAKEHQRKLASALRVQVVRVRPIYSGLGTNQPIVPERTEKGSDIF
jgi:hypothetical protein